VFDAANGLIQVQLQELPCLEPMLNFDAPLDASSAVFSVLAAASGDSCAAEIPKFWLSRKRWKLLRLEPRRLA
jgi:hypothetical protein